VDSEKEQFIDNLTINKKEEIMINYEQEAIMLKDLFFLETIPKVLGQCCDDVESSDGGVCTTGLIKTAQKHLDEGSPVIIKFFGRLYTPRSGVHYDWLEMYLPGMKIDTEIIIDILRKKKRQRIQTALIEKKGNSKDWYLAVNVLPGVFCDLEGTLIKRGHLNFDVLEKLNNYELRNNKRITLWTGGDTREYEEILDKIGLNKKKLSNWPIKSKTAFMGKTVEIAIDDLPEEEIETSYGIRAKKFIRVDEIDKTR
jgi:hypothetical protein